MSYRWEIEKLMALKEKGRPFLLGLTGGVASGKSLVSRMLEDLGTILIDFDILARRVVEPGKPAWHDIVGYFGEGVLFEDRQINRKLLSNIVFRDEQKRKKLEVFTHPRIIEEFSSLVLKYAMEDPDRIIQASIPLLFEIKLQDLFHRIIVVYVPEEVQIERLMKRDGISRDMAIRIVRAQLPIEEKRSIAHYVIDNSGSIEETRMQVIEIWNELKMLSKVF
jgi:dephospho-CoA kinase